MEQDQDINVRTGDGASVIDGGAAPTKVIALHAADFVTAHNASPYDDEAIVSYVISGSDYAPVDQEANPRNTKASTEAYESTVLSGYKETLELVPAYDSVMQSAQFEDLTGIPVGSYSAKFELHSPVGLVKGAVSSASAPSGGPSR